MNIKTVEAIDIFFTAHDKLIKGKIKDKEFGQMVRKIAEFDFRSEHEKEIAFLIEAFMNGCSRTFEIPSIARTALNSKKYEERQDILFFVKMLIASHYRYVQSVFWFEYKQVFRSSGVHGKFDAIAPKEIYEKIKSLKQSKK